MQPQINKVLIFIESEFVTLKCILLNENTAIYFSGDNLNCSKVYPTDYNPHLFVESVEESDDLKILAAHVKVVDEEEQLREVYEMIMNKSITLYDVVTKIFGNYHQEPNLGLIAPDSYKVKKV